MNKLNGSLLLFCGELVWEISLRSAWLCASVTKVHWDWYIHIKCHPRLQVFKGFLLNFAAHHLERQELNSPCTMSLAIETTGSRVPLPLPTHFSYAEQSFSLKKRRLPFSSSSTSNSSYSSPARLSHSVPPLPPSKGCPPLSRMFPQQPSPWTPLSCSLRKSPPPDSVYDPSKQQSYFSQCFTNLGLLGRGSFGEVYKVS